MKITKEQLRQIIKEELEAMEEAQVTFKDRPHRGPRTTSDLTRKYRSSAQADLTKKGTYTPDEVEAISDDNDALTAAAGVTNIEAGMIARLRQRLRDEIDKVLGYEWTPEGPVGMHGQGQGRIVVGKDAPGTQAMAKSAIDRQKQRARAQVPSIRENKGQNKGKSKK